MTLKLLLNLRANLKKLPLGGKLLQSLPTGTNVLQDLRVGNKIMKSYRMEWKHWGRVTNVVTLIDIYSTYIVWSV